MAVQVQYELSVAEGKVYLETFESVDQSVPGHRIRIDGDMISAASTLPSRRLFKSGRGGWSDFGGTLEFRTPDWKIRFDGKSWTARVGTGEDDFPYEFSRGVIHGTPKSIADLLLVAFA